MGVMNMPTSIQSDVFFVTLQVMGRRQFLGIRMDVTNTVGMGPTVFIAARKA
jgi:hypothetical protein